MKSILLSALLLLAVSLQAQAPASNPVPLKEEPHHHLIFENDYVRVWTFGIHGHDATLLHSHGLPYLGLALGAADFVNAVSGKPETHVTLTDGQVSYSKGGFAHLVSTETDTPFRNLTIELLKPQGAAKNRCVKVIADGGLDCLEQPPNADLGAVTTLVFETEVMAVASGEVTSGFHLAKMNTAHLLAVMDKSELVVEISGQPAKTLHAGEVMWLPAEADASLTKSAGGNAKFVVLTFRNKTPKS